MENFLKQLEQNPVLKAIAERFIAQQEKGYTKYGTLINLDHYSLNEWIEHAQQEMTDYLIYLESIKQKSHMIFHTLNQVQEDVLSGYRQQIDKRDIRIAELERQLDEAIKDLEAIQ